VVQLTPLQFVLWYLNIGVTIVLMVRLATAGLIPIYRWFSIYLFVDTVQQALLLWFRTDGDRGAQIHMGGQSIKMFLGVFVVLELYRLALAGHPALSRYGRNTVGYVLLAAAGIAVLGLLADRPVPPRLSRILFHFNSFERTIDAGLFVFLLIVSVFMSWFPVRLKRNVAFYIEGFVIYFFARSLDLFLQNALPHSLSVPLGNAMLTVSFACLLTWAVGMSRRGEEASVVVGHRWNPDEIRHLTKQLDAIDKRLSRL
jgi:hypothetical protein